MAKATHIRWPASTAVTFASLFKRPIVLLITALYSLSAFSSSYAADSSAFQFKGFKAEYQLKKIGMTLGTAKFSLHETATNTWRYASSIKPSGMARMFSKDEFSEASSVLFQDRRLTPIGYQYIRSGKKPEVASVSYDWAAKQATFIRNGESQSMPLQNNHQDRYSMVLALMQATAHGQQKMQYQVIDKSMKLRSYTRGGEEVIKTSLGKKNTIRIIQDSGRRQIHYWLSPELNYIPVRIEQFKEGKSQLKLTLKKLKWTD